MDLSSLVIKLSDYSGNWDIYVDALYEIFCRDFILDMPVFEKKEVDFCQKDRYDNKEETFWHVISRDNYILDKGKFIKDRDVDPKRAERIAWIKEIIDNSNDSSIMKWIDTSFREPRIHLWYKKEYIVVLVKKKSYPYYQLLTAFITKKYKEAELEAKFEKYGIKKPMSP